MARQQHDFKLAWRAAALGWLMFGAVSVVVIGGVGLSMLVLLPALGIDPSQGVNPRADPLGAFLLAVATLVPILVLIYLGACLGAHVALKRFERAEVEAEFCSLLWLPWLRPVNRQLFAILFPDRRSRA